MQSVDDGSVAADLLGHVLVLLHQSLGGELVVAHVHTGDDPQHIQHPRVDVVCVGLQGEKRRLIKQTKFFLFQIRFYPAEQNNIWFLSGEKKEQIVLFFCFLLHILHV